MSVLVPRYSFHLLGLYKGKGKDLCFGIAITYIRFKRGVDDWIISSCIRLSKRHGIEF